MSVGNCGSGSCIWTRVDDHWTCQDGCPSGCVCEDVTPGGGGPLTQAAFVAYAARKGVTVQPTDTHVTVSCTQPQATTGGGGPPG